REQSGPPDDYRTNPGDVMVDTCEKRQIGPDQVPGALVNHHGPFTWGQSAYDAVHNSVVLEEVSRMTYHPIQLNSNDVMMDSYLLDKHFLRKHGKDAYYGQK